MEKTFYYFTQLLILALAVQVLRIRAYRIVPWFSTYVWFAVIAEIVRFATLNYDAYAYFLGFWVTETVYVFLGLAALYEVYRLIFSGLTHTWWFRFIIIFLLGITCLLAVTRMYKFPPNTSSHVIATIVLSELVVRLLQGLMCVTLVPTLVLFPQRWKQYPVGIIIGFGLYAGVYVLATTYLSGFPNKFHDTWASILVSAYSVSVLIWLWFFRKPQPKDPESPNKLSLREIKEELDKYQDFLRRLRP